MAGQLRTLRIDTNTDGADATPLGFVLQTNEDVAIVADPSFGGTGTPGIRLAGGLSPSDGLTHSTAALTSVDPVGAPGGAASDPVYTGTSVNGIVLTNPATQNPLTVAATGYVTNQTWAQNGDAIYGAPVYPWT